MIQRMGEPLVVVLFVAICRGSSAAKPLLSSAIRQLRQLTSALETLSLSLSSGEQKSRDYRSYRSARVRTIVMAIIRMYRNHERDLRVSRVPPSIATAIMNLKDRWAKPETRFVVDFSNWVGHARGQEKERERESVCVCQPGRTGH